MKSPICNYLVIFLILCCGSDCFRGSSFSSECRYQMSPLFMKKNWGPPSSNPIIGAADISSLPRPEDSGGIKYSVDMTQKSGISWGSDLSFRWVYVLDIEQSGEASASGVVQKVAMTRVIWFLLHFMVLGDEELFNVRLLFFLIVGRLYRCIWEW